MGKNRDIKNLLIVLGSSVICAALLSYLFLYYYGPSGRYIAGHALLDPAIIKQINYEEKEANGQKVHFIFDKFEFSYFDKKLGKIVKIPVSQEKYKVFYQHISSLLSLENSKLEPLFMQPHRTLLTTSMKTDSRSRIFQIVDFNEEDYFRVQLQGKEQGEWAYFFQPHIYQETMTLFGAE